MNLRSTRPVTAVLAAVSGLLMLAGALVATAGAAQAAGLEPVILIHGWFGSSGRMATMRDALTAAGYPAYAIDLPGQENVANAEAIAGLVRTVRTQTGAARVHLVAHSMGGLAARYYIKYLGGVDLVRTYVSMGTAHYGYPPACVLGPKAGGQMCPSSAFLRDLDAGDDTLGDIAYTTLRHAKESADNTRLDGGACVGVPADVNHADEQDSPEFIAAVKVALAGGCPGTFVDLAIQ